jgi:trehalose 6-phosphate phosphatase
MTPFKPPTVTYDPQRTVERIDHAERLQLYLDYDGTLADFANSPDDVLPDDEVIQIMSELNANPALQISVVSGRRLSQIRKLIPVEGILLAGTYGVEMLTPEGNIVHRLEYEQVRPNLEVLKPQWEGCISSRKGFYLEDKGWSLAIHARFAEEIEAEMVLEEARKTAQNWIDAGQFHILGGNKFIEVAPEIANKGDTVAYLMQHYSSEGAISVYVGDDDKDEEAFTVVNAHGGVTILVAHEPRATYASCRLDSPHSVRNWLRGPFKDIAHPG